MISYEDACATPTRSTICAEIKLHGKDAKNRNWRASATWIVPEANNPLAATASRTYPILR
jgi:hypothetical protein